MIPEGMRDVLPSESAELHAIDEAVRGRFAAYGYGEVRTPTLEFADTLASAGDDTLRAGFRLFDEQGRVLMLRTDMTVPVARLAASRFRDKSLPLRFSYFSNLFRPLAPHRGQDGEFLQAGVELLGLHSPAADAECVTLLCDALAATGLQGFKVAIGTVAFHSALVASLRLSADASADMLTALADRDYPLLETIVSRSGVGDEARRAMQKALELAGGDEVLARAGKLASTDAMEGAVAHLEELHELVDAAGFGDAVTYDFGLFQDIDYYSGIIFEAYAPGVGFPIASGGRYDGLLAKFDWDIPAVGFAISVDRLHEALTEEGVAIAAGSPAIAFVGGLDEPERVAELRRAGVAVAALPAGQGVSPPSLVRTGGQYHLDLADGTDVHDSWQAVMRRLRAT
jgi:ATP phosphoribosyltransferase regulatory subunit